MNKISINKVNLFDFLRLYASTQVLIGHGNAFLDINLPKNVEKFYQFPGVPIFFAISGFLVAISWVNSNFNLKKYIFSRSLRILPGLWLSVFFSLLLIVTFGKSDFLFSFKGLIWTIGQATIFPFWNPSDLRNFGIGVINGSLWTIPVEIQFYFILPIIFFIFYFLVKRFGRTIGVSFLIFLALFSIISTIYIPPLPPGDGTIAREGSILIKLFYVSIIPYLSQFLMGTILIYPYKFLGQRKSSFSFISIGFILFLFGQTIPNGSILFMIFKPLCIALIVIGIGLLQAPFLIPFDISYGLYLYHGLVINFLNITAIQSRSYTLSLYLLITLLLSLMSYYMVESKGISLKRYLLAKDINLS